MKHADKNEVDLLLRGFAKRERDASSANGQEDHLDVDELNAYAEDALPYATRARYTTHIADCASCRRIVTQLTLAAGAAVRSEVASPPPGTTFWQKLAAIFSPAVLRYAAPALGVLAVITAGVIVLRQQSRSEYVARKETASSVEQTLPTSDAPAERGIADSPKTGEQSKAKVSTDNQRVDSPAEEKHRVVSEDREAGQSAGSGAATARDENERQAKAGAAAQPSYAPEPEAAPPPSPKDVLRDSGRGEVAKERERAREREKLAEEDAVAVRRGEVTTPAKDKRADKSALPAKTESRPNTGSGAVAQRRVQSLEAKKPTGNEQAKNDQEVRSVSGRRFRRDGNTWIDINYDSSRALLNVRRGSEQYRALVADEPGLRT
ncbi:MAG: zf-HC2 domain-containing protein, partial [Pyrinomonadaceae bacterium]